MARGDFVAKLPIGVSISGNAPRDIENELKQLSSEIKPLNIRMQIADEEVIKNTIKKIVAELNNIDEASVKKINLFSDKNGLLNAAVEYSTGIGKVVTQTYALSEATGDTYEAWVSNARSVVNYTQQVAAANKETKRIRSEITKLAKEYKELETLKIKDPTSTSYRAALTSDINTHEGDIANQILEAQNSGLIQDSQATALFDELVGAANRYDTALKKVSENTQKRMADIESAAKDSALKNIHEYLDLNPRIDPKYKQDLEDLITNLQNGAKTAQEADKAFDDIALEVNKSNAIKDTEEYLKVNPQLDGTQFRADLEQLISDLKTGQISLKAFEAKVKATKIDINTKAATDKAKTLASDIRTWLQDNPNAAKSGYFGTQLKKLADNLDSGRTSADKAKAEFKELASEAEKLGLAGETAGKKLLKALKDYANIATFAEAVRTTINTVKKLVDHVRELDDAMVDLQIASGASIDEVKRMMNEYHALAKELGATSIEVAQAADGWLRQGYSAAESTELIRSSTMLAKLGQMETAEATNALTSAMKGYQLGVEEAGRIVDKFAATDMNAAVSAGYLAEAMSKTAVGAKEMGIDFDTLTGYIATVGEVTQDSAETVGTFFKTLIARMGNIKAGNLVDPETAESLSDVESVLNSLGIELRDGQENFRSFKDILDEVYESWDNYNDVQRQSIAVAFAGTRNQEKFRVLMANYADAADLAAIATESNGVAVEKYGAYLDSITAKVEEFKTSVYNFADSFINSDLVKGVVDFGTLLVETATKVIDSIGSLPLILTGITVFKGGSMFDELFELSKVAKNATVDINVLRETFKIFDDDILKALDGMDKNSSAILKTFSLFSIKIKGAIKEFGNFGKAVGGLITRHIGLTFAIGAAAAIIISIIRLQNKAKKAYEESTKAVEEHSAALETLESEKSAVEELIKKYEDLKEAQGGTLIESDEAALDKHKEELKLLEKKIEYEEKIIAAQKKIASDNAIDVLKTSKGLDIKELRRATQLVVDTDGQLSAEELLKSATIHINKLNKEMSALDDSLVKGSISYEDYTARYSELKSEHDNYVVKADAFLKEVESYVEDVQDTDYKNVILSAIEGLREAIVNGEVAEGYTSAFAGLLDVIEEDSDALKGLKDTLNSVFKDGIDTSALSNAKTALEDLFGVNLNGYSRDQLIQILQIINAYINDDIDALEGFAQAAVKSLGITPNTAGIEGVIQSLNENIDKLNEADLSKAKTLLDLLAELGMVEVKSLSDALANPEEDHGTRIGNYFYSYKEEVEELTGSFISLQKAVSSGSESVEALGKQIDKALDWRNSKEQIQSALTEIEKLTGIKLDIDADGTTETLQLIKAYIDGDAEAFEEMAESAFKAFGIKPDVSGIEGALNSLVGDIGVFTDEVKVANNALIEFFVSLGAIKKVTAFEESPTGDGLMEAVGFKYEVVEDWLKSLRDSKTRTGSSGGSGKDAYLEEYNRLVKELDHLRAMDIISEEEYYRRLEALADQYLAGKSKYVDEYRSVQEQLWAHQKELYEQQRDSEIEAARNRADARKKALEKEYEAEKEALEKRKDLLEEEKDAYKDLIDYKKDLLDDASDERSHDQRVSELNQEIAKIEAQLAAIALDDSAKANAKRAELHEQLMGKQKELENEQWDWSVQNQKDALDEEYDRYESTIDAQIKLLEDQLDALEKSYDEQLDRIEDMLDANINAINSSFDALINRAMEAAAQIEAIFNNINVSTSSGITALQQGLVNAGYKIGDWGSNKDGVDGVKGKDTIRGLQQYLNDLQNSGAISFGSPLQIDGIVGSRTKKAIAAAIAAGYLDKSFEEFHTGGIVGRKSGRTDKEVLSNLIPINADEVWAKLLKNEMVLTEKQQDAVRNAFNAVASMHNIGPANKSRELYSSGSGSTFTFDIRNVFEGSVDADALRRLDEWGNKFKKDVQNNVFKTMNQQNKFAGKTPIKSV